MSDYDAITRAAVENAREVLRQKLREALPTADVERGSVLGDLLVDGHSTIFQILKDQIELARNQQSLLRLQNLPPTESVNDAADALLANFFRFRSQGKFAKGVATLFFSQRADVLVLRNARFFKTTSLVFYLDSASDLFVPASELRPVLDGNGVVQAYATDVFLTAARTGDAYNIDPGAFVGFDRFNATLLSVQNTQPFQGGSGVQTTSDFINGSTSALSLRALVNARSNDSTLLNKFDTSVQSTLTIGYGDPEMVRDRLRLPGSGAVAHIGGHVDVFVRQPLREVVDRLTVGALSARNDGKALIFRHTATTPSGSFVTAGVKVGDVLNIAAGLPAPAVFKVTAVRATELEIAPEMPFAVATDEATTPAAITYSVGSNYPTFDNRVAVVSTTDATTSSRFSQLNRVQMPGLPVVRVKRVEVLAPLPTDLQPYADPATGSVIFTTQKNTPALAAPSVGSELAFFTECLNPQYASSTRAVYMVEVGWRTLDLAGLTVQVTYDTPYEFSAVDAFVVDRNTRSSNSNMLVRSPYAVYVYASIPYRQRLTPVSPLETNVPIFDEVSIQKSTQTFITEFRDGEPLDVNTIATYVRDGAKNSAAIYEFKVNYVLMLPDGRMLQFETKDIITVTPDEVSNSAKLLNAADFGLPNTGYAHGLRALLSELGVSDRVTRYVASNGSIVFERRS